MEPLAPLWRLERAKENVGFELPRAGFEVLRWLNADRQDVLFAFPKALASLGVPEKLLLRFSLQLSNHSSDTCSILRA